MQLWKEKEFSNTMKFELSQLTAYHHLLFRSLIGNFSQEAAEIYFFLKHVWEL